jgi:outer membrane protein assembly factor BamB
VIALLVVLVLAAAACTRTAQSGNGGRAGLHGAAAPRVVSPQVAPGSSWTTFDQNGLRSGVDDSGASFSPASPGWTSPALDGSLFGQPLLATGRVYVATERDTVYSLAADSGAVLWSTHVGTPFDPGSVAGLCGDIHPSVGITSTPVIDPSRDELFVVAAEQVPGGASHHLVGIDLVHGAVELDQVVDPAGAIPAYELQRASLALVDKRVMIGFGGNYGDCGPYHGLVVSAPEGGGPTSLFTVATLHGDDRGAVWMGGAAPTVDARGNVWVSTGNSTTTTAGRPYDDSDGVLELSPMAVLLGAFAPAGWTGDNAADADLGSVAPALLADGLVFAVGKSTTGYVLRQSAPGGVGGQLASTPGFCGSAAFGGSADLHGILFVPCGDGLRAVHPTAAAPTALWRAASGVHGSPIVAGGLVWSIDGPGGRLYALDRASGATVQQFAIGPAATSFPSPAAADGLVVAPSGDRLHAFVGPAGLPGPPTPDPTSRATGAPPT